MEIEVKKSGSNQKEEEFPKIAQIQTDSPNKIIILNDIDDSDNNDNNNELAQSIGNFPNIQNNNNTNASNELVFNISDSADSVSPSKSRKLGKKLKKEYICNEIGCNKVFKDKSSLKKHLIIHGEKLFICEICKKKFLDNSKLRRHSLVHSGEKPYECPICNKKFSLDFNLRTHMRIHSGEKPYACIYPGCFKRFSQSSNLSAHEKVHELMKNNWALEEMNNKPIFYENPLKYMIENPYSGTETLNNIKKINEIYEMMIKGIDSQISNNNQAGGYQYINKNHGEIPGMPFQKRLYIKKINKDNNLKKELNSIKDNNLNINDNNYGVNDNKKILFKNVNSEKVKRQIFSTYKDPIDENSNNIFFININNLENNYISEEQKNANNNEIKVLNVHDKNDVNVGNNLDKNKNLGEEVNNNEYNLNNDFKKIIGDSNNDEMNNNMEEKGINYEKYNEIEDEHEFLEKLNFENLYFGDNI